MARQKKDEEEVIIALVIGLVLASVVIFMFAARV